MADLEARRQKLKEMREAREARRTVVGAASPSSAASEGTGGSTSPNAAVAALKPSSISTDPVLQVQSSVGVVTVASLPPPQLYDKQVTTEKTFVYDQDMEALAKKWEEKALNAQAVAAAQAAAAATAAGPAGSPTGANTIPQVSSSSHTLDEMGKAGSLFYGSFAEASASKSVTALQTMQSVEFEDFVSRASHAIERTLLHGNERTLEAALGIGVTRANQLSTRGSFQDPATAHRLVVSISHQPGSDEYFVASYAAPDTTENEGGEGVVLVWPNNRGGGKPAFYLNAEEEVSCVSYNPFHPQLIVGGTVRGRLLVWDVRQGTHPVQSSFPTLEGHSTRIHSIYVTGSATSCAIQTISVEGRLCSWAPDKVVFPLTTCDMRLSAGPLPTTCAALPPADPSKIYVAAPDGQIYDGVRGGSSSRNIMATRLGDGHRSPVTSLSAHPIHSSDPRCGNLLLSSGMDWSCRVWLEGCAAPVTIDQFSDFVYDAQWSPTHPAVMAAVDGSGLVGVWNVATTTEAPVATARVYGKDGELAAKTQAVSANRVSWESSGEHVAVGCSNGDIVVLRVGANLVHPSQQDLAAFSSFISHSLGGREVPLV